MPLKPSSNFRVRRNGEAIQRLTPGNTIATGITLGIEIPGLVAGYEEYAAMVAANYNESQWQEIGWRERARAVAYYRLEHSIRVHQEDAVTKAMKRKHKR